MFRTPPHFALRLSALLLTLSLAGGCSAYSISESQLNQQLTAMLEQQQLNHLVINLHQQQFEMQLSNLQLKLLEYSGEAHSNENQDSGIAQVGLTSALTGQINLFGQPLQLQAQLEPQLESGLRYTEGALYLVNPRLTRLGLQGNEQDKALLQPLLSSVKPTLEKGLANWFALNPVYRLGDSEAEQFARQNLESVTIRQGRLQLNFDQGSEEDQF